MNREARSSFNELHETTLCPDLSVIIICETQCTSSLSVRGKH